MSSSDPGSGLIACDECGAPHPLQQVEVDGETGTNVVCPQCGHDTFTELDEPSAL